MRKFMRDFALILLVSAAIAQTKIPVALRIGDYGQLGYKKPDIEFSAGIEYFGENYWFNFAGKLNPTDKIAYGNVTQTSIGGELFWKNTHGLFLGGGGELRNITFHDAGQNYWTAGPIISGGWTIKDLRITLEGRPPRYDRRYNFYGVSWSALYDIKGRLRIGFEQGIYNVSRKGGQEFGNCFVSSAMVGFVF